jgi:putative membrane protein
MRSGRLTPNSASDIDIAYAHLALAFSENAEVRRFADAFIPNIENAAVEQAFEGALAIFRGHERHAETLVERL